MAPNGIRRRPAPWPRRQMAVCEGSRLGALWGLHPVPAPPRPLLPMSTRSLTSMTAPSMMPSTTATSRWRPLRCSGLYHTVLAAGSAWPFLLWHFLLPPAIHHAQPRRPPPRARRSCTPHRASWRRAWCRTSMGWAPPRSCVSAQRSPRSSSPSCCSTLRPCRCARALCPCVCQRPLQRSRLRAAAAGLPLAPRRVFGSDGSTGMLPHSAPGGVQMTACHEICTEECSRCPHTPRRTSPWPRQPWRRRWRRRAAAAAAAAGAAAVARSAARRCGAVASPHWGLPGHELPAPPTVDQWRMFHAGPTALCRPGTSPPTPMDKPYAPAPLPLAR
jgi:hypothetical protein